MSLSAQMNWELTCNFPLSSRSPLHFTKILSSMDRRIKSRGVSIDIVKQWEDLQKLIRRAKFSSKCLERVISYVPGGWVV